MRSIWFALSAVGLMALSACSSGSGGGSGAGGSAGAGAFGGVAASAGSGGSAGAAGGGAGGQGAGGGIGGFATGGSAGQSGGSGGVAGSAGAGGNAGAPQTPGCDLFQGDCSGGTGCATKLYTEADCGACGVSCGAFQSCIGSVCAESINPYSYSSSQHFHGRDGVILVFKDTTSVRVVAKVGADVGVATKFGTLEGDAYTFCSSPTVAEGPDGAVYFSCTGNRIFKIPANGGKAADLLQGSEPKSNNVENLAVLGTKLFYVGSDGIYRVNVDGTGNELWTKNYCVSQLSVDEALSEVVFACRYDHKIRVRGANKGPELNFVYDRELAAQAESGLFIDATHYWYTRLDKLVGSFYQGALLRIPKQGGAQETMLDIFSPPVPRAHVGKAGPYALQMISEKDHHFRILKVGPNGAHQVVRDWVRGYGKTGSSMFFVGKSNLIFEPYGKMVRLPL